VPVRLNWQPEKEQGKVIEVRWTGEVQSRKRVEVIGKGHQKVPLAAGLSEDQDSPVTPERCRDRKKRCAITRWAKGSEKERTEKKEGQI